MKFSYSTKKLMVTAGVAAATALLATLGKMSPQQAASIALSIAVALGLEDTKKEVQP